MIVIVDSGGANISSIQFALERLDLNAVLTRDLDKIRVASHVILPGVGAAKDAMQNLQKEEGLIQCLKDLTQPVLGICLGMQLLFSFSEEGHVDLLNFIDDRVEKFKYEDGLTIPHMGWNTVFCPCDHPLTENIQDKSYFYFVHSYRASVCIETIGQTEYGSQKFSAIVAKDNVMGCQFHPERSGIAGAQIFKNFLNM